MDNTLNRRLVILRERVAGKRGQRQFARMVGIKQQSISNYERGSVPSANVLAKIVLMTGVSADWLLTGRGPMFPEGVRDPGGADDEADLTYVDDNNQPIGSDQVAEILDVTPDRARSFLDSLRQSPAGRERLPVVLRRADGRVVTLHPRVISDDKLARRVRVEVTETEVQLRVPDALLRNRAVRLIPEHVA